MLAGYGSIPSGRGTSAEINNIFYEKVKELSN
jgi:hypothetical protein